MTRRNEIIEEAEKHMYDWGVDVDRFDVPDIFTKAAEWADKTMIEKATQWLFENVYDYLNPEDQERVESFRKYLEE